MKRKIKFGLYAVLCITLLILFVGCFTTGDEPLTKKEDMKTVCLDGVTYYQFKETVGYSGYGFMSVKFNRNGTVQLCEN